MDTLWWVSGGALTWGMEGDLGHALPTMVLSVLVAAGYAAIALGWYWRSRLGTREAAGEARAALRRMGGIAAASAACALVFVLADFGWTMWRVYDVALAGLAGYTWWVAWRTRGGAARVAERLERAGELERAAAAMEEQARRRAFVFNAISHDLRAPLNSVVLNAHVLKMTALQDRDLNNTADAMVESAMAANALVTKLLEVERLGADGHNEVGAVRVDELLRQVERRYQPAAIAKALYVRVEGEAPAVTVMTDRLKLERIVGNLVDNAIKFTEHGGITLELTRRGDEVVVGVTDTGPGVPVADVPHVFEEFYQVGNREKDGRKGFGMGLAICRSLARQLGGDVGLAWTGERGTRFEVRVPVGTVGAGADRLEQARQGEPIPAV